MHSVSRYTHTHSLQSESFLFLYAQPSFHSFSTDHTFPSGASDPLDSPGRQAVNVFLPNAAASKNNSNTAIAAAAAPPRLNWGPISGRDWGSRRSRSQSPSSIHTFSRFNEYIYIRGREDQERFFRGWKVLKVCSKIYIKNYPFFWMLHSIIVAAQTLPWFFQLVTILAIFLPFSPTSSTLYVMLL